MNETTASAQLDSRKTAVLLVSVLVVALCGITYELIIATVSSYLLGNSVYQFSITIGLFMFAMGIGSYLTKRIEANLVERFIIIEIAVAIIGGLSSVTLFVVFPYEAVYQSSMYLLIMVIGTLVGLEIPILTRILSNRAALKESIAHVLSIDYVGALIGSVSFPILLLPTMGLFRSSFAIGLLNIGVATVTIMAFGRSINRFNTLLATSVGGFVLLVVGMLSAEHITHFAESRLFSHAIIYRQQSEYQHIIVTQNPHNKDLRLYLDYHIQFASQDEHRYHEALVHPVLCQPGKRENILILGGGDGLAAREVLKYADVKRIDLVDIDPAITKLCNSLAPIRRLNGGSLDDPRVHIHHVDGFNFVRNTKENHFDRVIIDLPDPRNEALSKLYSVEFYKQLKKITSDDHGFIVTQSSSPFFAREVFWCIAATFEEAGMDTFSYQIPIPSFSIWGFTMVAVSGKVPTTFPLDDKKTRYLTQEVVAAGSAFGKDNVRTKQPANYLFGPVIYQLYQRSNNR